MSVVPPQAPHANPTPHVAPAPAPAQVAPNPAHPVHVPGTHPAPAQAAQVANPAHAAAPAAKPAVAAAKPRGKGLKWTLTDAQKASIKAMTDSWKAAAKK